MALRLPGQSFDRRIEVTSVQKEVREATDLHDGIRHGYEKVLDRDKQGVPIPPPREVSIYLKLKTGMEDARGMKLDRLPDGTYRRLRPNDGQPIMRNGLPWEGNLFDDITDKLNATPEAACMDRVTIADPDVGVLAEFAYDGTSWKRV